MRSRPNTGPTATDVGRALDLDAGYLSRVLRDFEKRGLIKRQTSPNDARQSHLTLSPLGRRTFAPLDRRSQTEMGAMLGRLKPAEQARLIAAMNTIESLLGAETTARSEKKDERTYILRDARIGDFGWIVKRNAEFYAEAYHWIEPFEGVCAQIVADFANNYDRKRERCWIAEMDGENVGSIMLAKETDDVARLRLLFVEPQARGLGLGARLTEECVSFARRAGYKKVTLWTHSILTPARHIYKQTGFTLTRSEERMSWSQPVVSEHWDLTL